MSLPESLNRQFAIDGHLHFTQGQGGMPRAVIKNDLASAEVYLHGGHVTSYVPGHQADLLWLSEQACFEPGKAIRGGIPVIWPWFGPHPDGSKPQHGFARTSSWTVGQTRVLDNGGTAICLQLAEHEQSRLLWPHDYELQLCIEVGQTLQVELLCRNTGTGPFKAGAALHSYFRIGDIEKIRLSGLDGSDYIDQLDAHRLKHQTGDLVFHGEVDRIYVDTEADCLLHDPLLGRNIRISKSGSLSTVVWNPWQEKARAMSDFPDSGYRHMLCIETANAGPDVRELGPGEEHRLRQHVSVTAV